MGNKVSASAMKEYFFIGAQGCLCGNDSVQPHFISSVLANYILKQVLLHRLYWL